MQNTIKTNKNPLEATNGLIRMIGMSQFTSQTRTNVVKLKLSIQSLTIGLHSVMVSTLSFSLLEPTTVSVL